MRSFSSAGDGDREEDAMTTPHAIGDEQAVAQSARQEQLDARLDAAEAAIESAIMRAGWERPLDEAQPGPGVASGPAYGRGRLPGEGLQPPEEGGARQFATLGPIDSDRNSQFPGQDVGLPGFEPGTS